MKKLWIYLFSLVVGTGMSQNMNLLPDTFGICSGDITLLELMKKFDKSAKIVWNDPYMGIIEFTSKLPVVKSGKYKVKVTVGKNTYYDSTVVLVNSKPLLNLRDTVLCNGKAAWLDAKNPKMRYAWSTGESTQTIRVESSGIYWVKVNNNGCVQSDTAYVKFVQGSSPNFGKESIFCLSDENKALTIKALPNTRIFWSNGSVYPSISVTKEGVYWVRTENKSCGEQIDSVKVVFRACDCEMLIPNSFTPNEDGKNDLFFPALQCDYSIFNMVISDRWDNVVYSSSNSAGKWDGRFKGNLCPEDVYVYEIESVEKISGKKISRRGKVSLFR